MCIAVSGKLIEKQGSLGRVDINGNILSVELGIVEANVGDYLLVHAGCAISVVSKEENDELAELLDLIGGLNG